MPRSPWPPPPRSPAWPGQPGVGRCCRNQAQQRITPGEGTATRGRAPAEWPQITNTTAADAAARCWRHTQPVVTSIAERPSLHCAMSGLPGRQGEQSLSSGHGATPAGQPRHNPSPSALAWNHGPMCLIIQPRGTRLDSADGNRTATNGAARLQCPAARYSRLGVADTCTPHRARPLDRAPRIPCVTGNESSERPGSPGIELAKRLQKHAERKPLPHVPPEVGGGGIFVSYRRKESSDLAGRLHDHLADRFGEDQVFHGCRHDGAWC